MHVAEHARSPGIRAGNLGRWGGFVVKHVATRPGGVFEPVELLPWRPTHLAVTARSFVLVGTAMAVLLIRADMVFTFPHAFGAQDFINMSRPMRLSPPLHDIVHVPMKLAMVIAERRVVKDTTDVVEHLVHRNVGMLPCINNPRSHVLKDCSSNLSRRLIQNVRKMIFGEKRVGGIRAKWVGPGLVLMLAAGINDA